MDGSPLGGTRKTLPSVLEDKRKLCSCAPPTIRIVMADGNWKENPTTDMPKARSDQPFLLGSLGDYWPSG